jgi:microcystin-dependent protein
MGVSSALGGTVGAVPAGAVMPFAGANAPAGWMLCAGQAVSRTQYVELFLTLGTTYGVGDGSTTFNLPDLRGRVAAGLDNMNGTDAGRLTWDNFLGNASGSQTHTLTTAEMPSHSHQQHGNFGSYAGSAFLYGTNWYGAANGASTSSTGGGGAHNNMQPTILLNYIIKA